MRIKQKHCCSDFAMERGVKKIIIMFLLFELLIHQKFLLIFRYWQNAQHDYYFEFFQEGKPTQSTCQVLYK